MRISVVLICLLALFITSDSGATMYKYTDEYGNDFYADRLEAIPKKYISRAQIIDDHLEKVGLTIEPERTEQEIRIKVLEDTSLFLEDKRHRFLRLLESIDYSLLNSEVVKYAVMIITFIVIVVLLLSVREYIGPRKVGMMLVAVMGLFAFMFIYNAYIKRVVDSYMELNERASELRSATEDRYRLINELSGFNSEKPQKSEKFVPPWEEGESDEQ
jgi:hypothetical protein